MKVVITKNTLGPGVARMVRQTENRAPLLMAIGQRAVGHAVEAFTQAALRLSTWPAKKDGSKATLYKSGALRHSLRVVDFDSGSVTVGSDRPYAAIHQLGGKTRPHVIKPKNGKALRFPGANGKAVFAASVNHPGSVIPARPYFPIGADDSLEPSFKRDVDDLVSDHLDLSR